MAYRLLDAGVVAASPSTIYRALKAAGRLDCRWQRPTRKGTGFERPQAPHEPCPASMIDVAEVNVPRVWDPKLEAEADRRKTGRTVG
ncbi:MAG: hypothetical protein U0836_25050 [Pirellulales bacterium]